MTCDYLSVLALKSIYVSKGGPRPWEHFGERKWDLIWSVWYKLQQPLFNRRYVIIWYILDSLNHIKSLTSCCTESISILRRVALSRRVFIACNKTNRYDKYWPDVIVTTLAPFSPDPPKRMNRHGFYFDLSSNLMWLSRCSAFAYSIVLLTFWAMYIYMEGIPIAIHLSVFLEPKVHVAV